VVISPTQDMVSGVLVRWQSKFFGQKITNYILTVEEKKFFTQRNLKVAFALALLC